VIACAFEPAGGGFFCFPTGRLALVGYTANSLATIFRTKKTALKSQGFFVA
jgi:hypothetical protein